MPAEELEGTRIEPVFPLTIYLPHAGYKRSFADLPLFQAWIREEESAWTAFLQRLPPNFRDPINPQRGELRQLERAAKRLEQGVRNNDLTPDQDLARIVTDFNATKYIPAASPTGRMIIELESDGPGLGAVILCAMRDEPLSVPVEMGAVRIDLTKAIKLAEAARLLTSHFRQFFERERRHELEKIREIRAAIEETHFKIEGNLSDKVNNLNETITLARVSVDEIKVMIEAAEERLQTLEQRYKVDKEYGKAISYWTEKREAHTKMMRKSFILLTTLFITPLVVLVFNIEGLLTAVERLARVSEKAWIPLATVMSLAGFCYVGFVRLIGRLNRESSAEQDDAHLRETLINTYLALRLDPTHPLNDGERLLALHAMFRGSARAPTADDTPPVNTLEALINTLKPGGGKG